MYPLGILAALACVFTAVEAGILGDSLHNITGIARIHPRQLQIVSLNDFPPACRPACQPAVTTVNDPKCQLNSCQCSLETYQELSSCFGCVAGLYGTFEANEYAQALLDGFVYQCAITGFPITGSGVATPTETSGASPRTTSLALIPSFSVPEPSATGPEADDDNRPAQNTVTAPGALNTPNFPGNGTPRFGVQPAFFMLAFGFSALFL
ncbi:hypothetical protein ONZ45_g5009 [Pleurotus djamor]|nr:hypothetical protein ONZ45_g5009 [Pleurotus djamor]